MSVEYHGKKRLPSSQSYCLSEEPTAEDLARKLNEARSQKWVDRSIFNISTYLQPMGVAP
jgi:hypothetical protein